MSEPTYRIEFIHDPGSGESVEWESKVYRVVDGDDAYCQRNFYGASHVEVFDKAQAWCKAASKPPKTQRPVYLSEDGDILDPHEVQR